MNKKWNFDYQRTIPVGCNWINWPAKSKFGCRPKQNQRLWSLNRNIWRKFRWKSELMSIFFACGIHDSGILLIEIFGAQKQSNFTGSFGIRLSIYLPCNSVSFPLSPRFSLSSLLEVILILKSPPEFKTNLKRVSKSFGESIDIKLAATAKSDLVHFFSAMVRWVFISSLIAFILYRPIQS